MRVPSKSLRILNLFALFGPLVLGSMPINALAGVADLTRHLRDHVRGTGAPDVGTDTFFGTGGGGRLIVINGNDSDSASRETSADITLNGETVLRPGSFKKAVGELEIPVEWHAICCFQRP